jgi:hypothetical protein
VLLQRPFDVLIHQRATTAATRCQRLARTHIGRIAERDRDVT